MDDIEHALFVVAMRTQDAAAVLRAEIERLREVDKRRKHELLHLHRCCVENEADAERWRKLCRILESESGEVRLDVWRKLKNSYEGWDCPYTKQQADEAIEEARENT